jgi:pimeloyl-ACP methyl ester carboxylesterase
MDAAEVRAFGELGGRALASPAVTARDVHRALAGRVFGALGRVGAPVRVVHDGISRAAYASVSTALRVPLQTGGAAIARGRLPGGRSMAGTPAGAFALGALNGMWGDTIATTHPELAIELSIRKHGQIVVTDSAGLAEAYGEEATGKLAVFVHGLCENDGSWRGGYGGQLQRELGYTPLYVRYNTGLHVSDNGRRLAEILEHVVAGWPVAVHEVTLIGHSMGGLVARSACHYGEDGGHKWTDRLRHVFCLGTPHLGAPLERAANRAGWALGRLPETRPLANLINVRSAGVKDMRFGNCVEEDWCDCDPDELLNDRCTEVPFLPRANYYFVGATLTRDPDSRAARVVGDLFVQFASASGNGPRRRIPFEVDNGCHVGGINHFQLLNHPAVYEQLRNWLTSRAIPAAA